MIDDFSIQSDDHTNQFVQELTNMVQMGEILYIHCLGGHGRTGTISIPLLIALYGIPEQEASEKVNFYHQARQKGHGWCSMPEDESQIEQIQKMEPVYQRNHKRGEYKKQIKK